MRNGKNSNKKKSKKLPAENTWKTFAYVDTPTQRDRLVKRLKKQGYQVRWQKIASGRNAGAIVIQTRIPVK